MTPCPKHSRKYFDRSRLSQLLKKPNSSDKALSKGLEEVVAELLLPLQRNAIRSLVATLGWASELKTFFTKDTPSRKSIESLFSKGHGKDYPIALQYFDPCCPIISFKQDPKYFTAPCLGQVLLKNPTKKTHP